MTLLRDEAAAADVRARWRGPSLGLLLAGALMVAACGQQSPGPTAADASGGTAADAAEPPEVRRLAAGAPKPVLGCPTGERSVMHADPAPGATGAPTPEEALAPQKLKAGERLVISRASTTAWVVRADGSAREEIGLLEVRGWVVQRRESCG